MTEVLKRAGIQKIPRMSRRKFLLGTLGAAGACAIASPTALASEKKLAEAKYNEKLYKFALQEGPVEVVEPDDGIQMPVYDFRLRIPTRPHIGPEEAHASLISVLKYLYKRHRDGYVVLMDKGLSDEIGKFIETQVNRALAKGELQDEQNIYNEYSQLMSHIKENNIYEKRGVMLNTLIGAAATTVAYTIFKAFDAEEDMALVKSAVGGLGVGGLAQRRDVHNHKKSILNTILKDYDPKQHIKGIIIVKKAD